MKHRRVLREEQSRLNQQQVIDYVLQDMLMRTVNYML